MAFTIEHDLEVAVPAPTLWQVIADLPAYGEWNPFVVACESTLEVGSPIHMRVHVMKAFAQPQTEIIFEHEPGRLLSYGLKGDVLGGLKSYRSHTVTDLGNGRSRYQSKFELSGWLVPLVALFVGRNLRRGFTEMSEAIVKRAESLA